VRGNLKRLQAERLDHMYSRRLRYVPVMLVMGIIFFLSQQDGSNLILPDIAGIDKLAHGLIYAVLAAAALFAVRPDVRVRKSLRIGALVILFCLLYGMTDEYHQSFIPGRCPSGWDILADTLGAMVTVLIWGGFLKTKSPQRIIPSRRRRLE